MTSSERRFRRVELGSTNADAVTVGIESGTEGRPRAAVWWESKGDVDADEAEFDDVGAAFEAAEAARSLHGFSEIVVVVADGVAWHDAWGSLDDGGRSREPIGDVRQVDLSDREAFHLAQGIEEERDA
ncbi:hypothetical protein ACFSX5_06845 [Devosia albogilva]|uniref:Uncharacterized protein n=1 Tax=Devosia albogilva TaxID=429726 RepID=A0ABW5QIH9_9HYPH